MEHLTILHWFTKYSFVCIPVLAFLLDLLIGILIVNTIL